MCMGKTRLVVLYSRLAVLTSVRGSETQEDRLRHTRRLGRAMPFLLARQGSHNRSPQLTIGREMWLLLG